MGPATSTGACRLGTYREIPSPFSMDDETFRGLGHRLVDILASYLDKLPQEPVYRPLPAEVRQELEEMDIPDSGAAPEEMSSKTFYGWCCHTAAARIIHVSLHLLIRPHPS